jgi:hypothetical protein
VPTMEAAEELTTEELEPALEDELSQESPEEELSDELMPMEEASPPEQRTEPSPDEIPVEAPAIEEEFEEPPLEDEVVEEEFLEEGVEEPSHEAPEESDPDVLLEESPNPLNSAGYSIDRLIELQINEDVWVSMLGDLPCLDASELCVRQLQELAIGNSPELMAIDERVALVQEKIDAARADNLRSLSVGVFEPAVRAFFEIGTTAAVAEQRDVEGNIITEGRPGRRFGFLDRIAMFFEPGGTIRGINDIFAQIGLPLFTAVLGGNDQFQQRQIAISDLEIKVAEIENKRGELASELREKVLLEVLDFDQYRREFQISQEIARRDTLRIQILAQGYQFAAEGSLSTPEYLSELSRLDGEKAQMWRSWTQLRTQLTRVKLLILGAEAF